MRFLVWTAALALACSSSSPAAPTGVHALYDFASADFFDAPYPSDQRLKDGAPDVTKFPNPTLVKIVDDFVRIVCQRKGFPVLPVVYVKFDGPIAPMDLDKVIPADKAQPILLVDVDPASPERGALTPVVATVPPADTYVPDNLLAIAPRPGFVLAPKRTYALVIKRGLNDASGKPLLVSKGFDVSASKPLSDVLATLAIDPMDVAVATVFTTGDVVKDTFDLTSAVLQKYKVTIDGMTLHPMNDQLSDKYCRVDATIKMPQFQKGTPPYATDGLFDIGADGLPIKQRDESVNVVITLPKTTMPASGFPVIHYVHGSGGYASQFVDGQGEGMDVAAHWPAYVNASHGIAMYSASMPVNPERLPGADDIEYLNLSNPTAMRDT